MATASFWQNHQVVLGGISVAYREGLVCGSFYNSELFYLEVMEHEESETREEGDSITFVDPCLLTSMMLSTVVMTTRSSYKGRSAQPSADAAVVTHAHPTADAAGWS